MNIGDWVRRRGQRWHLTESVVAEDAITRCGRRMDRVTKGGELQVSAVMPLTRLPEQPQLCKAGCQVKVKVTVNAPHLRPIVSLEDDATTSPVEAGDVPV